MCVCVFITKIKTPGTNISHLRAAARVWLRSVRRAHLPAAILLPLGTKGANTQRKKPPGQQRGQEGAAAQSHSLPPSSVLILMVSLQQGTSAGHSSLNVPGCQYAVFIIKLEVLGVRIPVEPCPSPRLGCL